jgi:acrosin
MLTLRLRSFDRVWSRTRRRRQRLLDGALQEIESRVLLSITAQVVAGVATFTGDQAADTLYLRANASNQLEYSTDGVTYSNQLSGTIFTFAQRSQIAANLGGGDDTLALDTTLTGALKKFKATLAYDSGAGSNTLRGSDGPNTWNITGVDSGNLGTVSFTSVGNLSGGTGPDTFSLSGNSGLTGSIDGGAGTDTLDWSAFTSSRQVTLTGPGNVDGLAGTEASIAGGFTNIDSLRGGTGSDTLTGRDAAATWQVGATDVYTSGNSLSFSSFENLVGGAASDTFQISGKPTANVSGGAGADTFQFADKATLTGTIDGGAGIDTLDWSAYQSARQVQLTAVGASDGFAGTESSISCRIPH